MADAGDGKCEVNANDGSKCNQPAVATLVYPKSSHRICEGHAKQMENTGGPHAVKRD
jgi:hypothetical protein